MVKVFESAASELLGTDSQTDRLTDPTDVAEILHFRRTEGPPVAPVD